MSKIGLILAREYSTRVKKKSFIIMTLLGPILFAALILGPTLIMKFSGSDDKSIAVVDDSHLFFGIIKNTDNLHFNYDHGKSLDELKKTYKEDGYFGVLHISEMVTYEPNSVTIFSEKQPSFDVKSHISRTIETEVEKIKLQKNGIEKEVLDRIKTSINVRTIKLEDGGKEKESSTEVTSVVAYISGFMIYMFIFMFGVQVMRGVIEEKTSRIVEVIVSSVKPFQLMLGKIIGIACVGLTQFVIWILLTSAIVLVGQKAFMPNLSSDKNKVVAESIMEQSSIGNADVSDDSNDIINTALTGLKNLPIGLLVGMFIFYFLGGYLLYAAMFAIVGAAVDNETDTQQFMAPVTIPLVLGIFVMMSAITNPDGPISFWFSMIPFTSPIVMMARLPFGLPVWQLVVSAGLLIFTFLFMTWIAAKIYRVGILMYGKKPSYKELWKWMKYKR